MLAVGSNLRALFFLRTLVVTRRPLVATRFRRSTTQTRSRVFPISSARLYFTQSRLCSACCVLNGPSSALRPRVVS